MNLPSDLLGPGTSLKLPGTNQTGGPSPAVRYGSALLFHPPPLPPPNTGQTVWEPSSLDLRRTLTIYNLRRPVTQAGRPITGFLRPSTQSGRPGTIEQAIKTPRTAYTARPIASSSGRFVRLGTVSSGSCTVALDDQSNLCNVASFSTLFIVGNYMEDFWRWFFFTCVGFIILWMLNSIFVSRESFSFSCSVISPHRLPCLQVLMDLS